MPSGTVISNLNGLRFVKGFIYATAYNADGSARTTDGVAHGALQDISIEHNYGEVMLAGPESLAPLAVGISDETLTFTAKHGVIGLHHFATYIGGTVAVSGGNSVYTKAVNQEPNRFDFKLKTPGDGSDMTVVLYGCVANRCNIVSNVANRQFHVGDFGGRAYGQGATDSSVLFTVTMPGNYTLSS